MSSSRRLELAVQEPRAPPQFPQRDADGVAGDVAGPGPQRGEPGYQGGRGVPGEPGSQVIGAGQEQSPGLVDRPGALSGGTAPGDHQRPDRFHGTVPAFRRAAGPAGLRRPRGADRVQRIGFALPAPVLPVRAVHLDHPDASCGDMASQSGAVTAGPFDADQGDGPEPAQPAQQAGIASSGGRELPDAEQPADGIQRGGDMGICVGVHAAGNCGATGNGACFFYDGHSHPFLRLRGGTHPLARRTCEPWPLVQAGQIRPAPLAGAIKPGARPTDRLAGQPGRRQPNRRSGRDPGSRRYAPVQSRSGKPRQKHYPQSPCRIFARANELIVRYRPAQIARIWMT